MKVTQNTTHVLELNDKEYEAIHMLCLRLQQWHEMNRGDELRAAVEYQIGTINTQTLAKLFEEAE